MSYKNAYTQDEMLDDALAVSSAALRGGVSGRYRELARQAQHHTELKAVHEARSKSETDAANKILSEPGPPPFEPDHRRLIAMVEKYEALKARSPEVAKSMEPMLHQFAQAHAKVVAQQQAAHAAAAAVHELGQMAKAAPHLRNAARADLDAANAELARVKSVGGATRQGQLLQSANSFAISGTGLGVGPSLNSKPVDLARKALTSALTGGLQYGAQRAAEAVYPNIGGPGSAIASASGAAAARLMIRSYDASQEPHSTGFWEGVAAQPLR